MPSTDQTDKNAAGLGAEGLINETRAAELLGVDRTTLRRWREGGTAPPSYVYPTGAVRYVRADVLEWREEHRTHDRGAA